VVGEFLRQSEGKKGLGAAIPEEQRWKRLGVLLTVENGSRRRRRSKTRRWRSSSRRAPAQGKDGGEGRPARRGEELTDAATYRAAAAAFGQLLSGPAGDLFPARVSGQRCPAQPIEARHAAIGYCQRDPTRQWLAQLKTSEIKSSLGKNS
jgi:hypothetical protein